MTTFVSALLSVALLVAPSSATPAPASPNTAVPPVQEGRVIVLGFDGADGRTVEGMMDAGELPNLRALRDTGTFARLGTAVPSESPAAWACLNTGKNPAKTGVPGFVMNTGQQQRGVPSPGLGHLRDRKGANSVPIEEFDNLPIPAWPAEQLAAAAFGAVFLFFLFVFAGLLRMRAGMSFVLSLLLAGLGGVAGYQVRSFLPASVPKTENPLDPKARNFWDVAADHGVQSIVLDAAQAFDIHSPEGARVVAGLGLPDARGGLGDWFIYTTDPKESDPPPSGRSTGSAGTVFRVDERGGRIDTQLYGPRDFVAVAAKRAELEQLEEAIKDPTIGYEESVGLSRQISDVKDALSELESKPGGVLQSPLEVVIEGETAVVTIDGVSQTLREGDWSDYFRVEFKMNPLISVHAITRIRLVHLNAPVGEGGAPVTELIVKRLDIDPEKPPFWQPPSSPIEFSGQVADSGLFDTYGWSTFTMPFKDGEIEPEILMEDVEFSLRWRERITLDALARDDWRLLMSVFGTTDRTQHMMYQFYDEQHPLYDAEVANREMQFFGETIRLADAIPAIYRQMDRVVGEVASRLGKDDVLLICSDHGFQSFRTQFHVNNWLVKNGYMTLKAGANSSSARSINSYVDWSETRAYSLGLGFVYLNQIGRERSGIVAEEERAELLAALRADLLAEVDETTGVRTVKEVFLPEVIHPDGDHLDLEADMILGFAPTYRVSWRTSGGGIKLEKDESGAWVPASIYEDNTSAWSGGHVSVNADDVRGVFFSNRRVDLPAEGPHVMHFAPTILTLLGVPLPDDLDLTPLAVN